MKIETGITKKEMEKIIFEASDKIPSKHIFKINIDDKKYDAILYCHVIYNQITTRNNMTGTLQYSQKNKKTINRIKVYNFGDFENIIQTQKQNNIFKIDKDDYYLGEIKKGVNQDNELTFIAVNVNRF